MSDQPVHPFVQAVADDINSSSDPAELDEMYEALVFLVGTCQRRIDAVKPDPQDYRLVIDASRNGSNERIGAMQLLRYQAGVKATRAQEIINGAPVKLFHREEKAWRAFLADLDEENVPYELTPIVEGDDSTPLYFKPLEFLTGY